MPAAWTWGSHSHSGASEWRGTLEGEPGPVSVELRYGARPVAGGALDLPAFDGGEPPAEVGSLTLQILDRPARVWATRGHDSGHEGVETVCVDPSDYAVFSLEVEVAQGVSALLERRVEFGGDAGGGELPEPWGGLLDALIADDRDTARGSVLVSAAEFLLAGSEPLAVRERASQRVALQVRAPVAGVSARREGGGLQPLLLPSEPRGSLEVGLRAERLRRVVRLDRIDQEWIADPGREVSLRLPDWDGPGQVLEQTTDAEGRATLSLRLKSPMSGLLVARGRSTRGASACFEILLRWGRGVEAHLGRPWPRVLLPETPEPNALVAACAENLALSYHPDWHAFRDWSRWTPTLVGHAAHRRPHADASQFAQHEAEVSGPIDGWLLGLLPEPEAQAPAALWRACRARVAGGCLRDLASEQAASGGQAPDGEWARGELWPLAEALRAGSSPNGPGVRALAARITARPAPFVYLMSKVRVGWEPERDSVVTQSLGAAIMVRLGEPEAAAALLDALPPDAGRGFDRHGTRFHALAALRLAVDAGLDRFQAAYDARLRSIWAALRAERQDEFSADALLLLAALGPGFLCYFP